MCVVDGILFLVLWLGSSTFFFTSYSLKLWRHRGREDWALSLYSGAGLVVGSSLCYGSALCPWERYFLSWILSSLFCKCFAYLFMVEVTWMQTFFPGGKKPHNMNECVGTLRLPVTCMWNILLHVLDLRRMNGSAFHSCFYFLHKWNG